MSETYSTDELVEEITVAFEARIESIDDGYTKSGDERLTKMAPTIKELTQRIKSIIIARLRAADKLCGELQEADLVICRLCKKVNPQHSKCTSCEDRETRLKAIADYDGKED